MRGEFGPVAALLADVFPESTIASSAYLDWLYAASPFGGVVRAELSDTHGLAAHYAVVPVDLAIDGKQVRGALSLNTAVHERARGGGAFVRLADETFSKAASAGIELIIGVANANSTPGFIRRLAFENGGPLPATVLVPLPGRARDRFRSGPATLDSPLLESIDELLTAPTVGLTRRWTPETLRWRLRRPGASYALHRSQNLLLVSTVERRGPVNIAVILAAFAAAPVPPSDVRAAVRAACRYWKAPVALHVGTNDRVPFSGPPLPKRLRASPLNFITRPLAGGAAPPAPSRFEFLDFDAY